MGPLTFTRESFYTLYVHVRPYTVLYYSEYSELYKKWEIGGVGGGLQFNHLHQRI